MDKKRLLLHLSSFSQQTVLVLGDLILDEYLLSSTGRVSREAPVLVTDFESSHHCLGGAGNVIMNLHRLGARVIPAGFIGDDSTADIICRTLSQADIPTEALIRIDGGFTTRKTRIMAGASHTRKQQILRIDYSTPLPIRDTHRETLFDRIVEFAKTASIAVISDYLSQSALGEQTSRLRDLAPSLPIITDSRRQIRSFLGSTYITPNEEEFCRLFGKEPDNEFSFTESAGNLIGEMNLKGIILKRGHMGMMVFDDNGRMKTIPAHGTTQIVDVTGAGDTVIAVAALGLCSGLSLFEAAALSNVAASIVVMHEGAYALTGEELRNELRENR